MRVCRGQVLAVEFDDHCEDDDEPMRFIVYGRVACVSRRHLVLDSWAHVDPERERDDGNVKRWTIVRSAIVRVDWLEVRQSKTYRK